MADPPNGDPGRGSLGATASSPQQGSPQSSELRRITRAYKRRRNDTTLFTGTNKTPSFEFSGGGEGRGTNLDEVAWLIASLKATVTQQNDIIEGLRAKLKEIKVEQQAFKKQHTESQAELREELKQVHEQLDTITRSIASANTSPNPSYANVARTPPVSLPSNVRTLSSFNTTPSTFTDTFYCTVDTSRAENSEGDRMSAGAIRVAVEREIQAMDDYTS